MMEKGTVIPVDCVKTNEGETGWVQFIDVMGSEAAVCEAARVSYGEGTRQLSDDVTLIRYLMRHRHTTPFEMVELKFRVFVPMDCWRQWIRHRTASVNEYSTRYSEAIDTKQVTTEWRAQSDSNKQGSAGLISDNMNVDIGTMFDGYVKDEHDKDIVVTPSQHLTEREAAFHQLADEVYQERLKFGVAREQARKDLPLSTFTKAYWKIDLHNLLHFLSLRMDSHAQQEIRGYANALASVVEALFPNIWQAFKDYRLDAVTLTGVDLRAYLDGEKIENKREREEYQKKVMRFPQWRKDRADVEGLYFEDGQLIYKYVDDLISGACYGPVGDVDEN